MDCTDGWCQTEIFPFFFNSHSSPHPSFCWLCINQIHRLPLLLNFAYLLWPIKGSIVAEISISQCPGGRGTGSHCGETGSPGVHLVRLSTQGKLQIMQLSSVVWLIVINKASITELICVQIGQALSKFRPSYPLSKQPVLQNFARKTTLYFFFHWKEKSLSGNLWKECY